MTNIPEPIRKKGYFVGGTVKYRNKFFLEMYLIDPNDGVDIILTAIQLETGAWYRTIHDMDFDKIIIYEDKFMCCTEKYIKCIDLNGDEEKIVIEGGQSDAYVQLIVNDKILYLTYDEDGEMGNVMCCDLDGSKRRKLLQYKTIKGFWGGSDEGQMKADEENIYLLETFCGASIVQIPMYGGYSREIIKAEWFDVTDGKIFYADEKNIYKFDPETDTVQMITKRYTPEYEIPFWCAGDYLMVRGYDEEEHEMLDAIWESEISNAIVSDIMVHYMDDYYWVGKDGEVADQIQGSIFKNRWKKLYDSIENPLGHGSARQHGTACR